MGTGKDLGKKVTSCLFAIAASLLLFGPASHAEEDIAGVVVDAHGDPVSLTDVFFATAKNTIYFKNGFVSATGGPRPRTNDKGEFTLIPQTEFYALFITHANGVALVTQKEFEANHTITLTPWGRIEGTYTIGSKLANKQPVSISTDSYFGNWVNGHYSAETDDQGHFVFERVVPGNVDISRGTVQSKYLTHFVWRGTVEVAPGKTSTVNLGGMGRPVIGRFAIPDEVEAIDVGRHSIYTKPPDLNYPADFDTMTAAEQNQWHSDWWKSDEGKAYSKTRQSYTVLVEPDGQFRAEDVPAGEFTLSAEIHNPEDDLYREPGDLIGLATIDFTIQPMDRGRSDEPLNLGMVEVEVQTILSKGSPVPEIVGQTLEGKDFKLSDYQGKYVLIDFWKIERYLDKATSDERKALYSRVANDEKFVRFSMNLDPNHSAPALTKVQQENYYWTQVVLDKSQIETINKTFALEFTPGLILIDPNGNLIIKSHSNKVWWTVGQLIP